MFNATLKVVIFMPFLLFAGLKEQKSCSVGFTPFPHAALYFQKKERGNTVTLTINRRKNYVQKQITA